MSANVEVEADPFPQEKAPTRHRFTHLHRGDGKQLCSLDTHPDGKEEVYDSGDIAQYLPLDFNVCPQCVDLDGKASTEVSKANHYKQLDQDYKDGRVSVESAHYAEAKARAAKNSP